MIPSSHDYNTHTHTSAHHAQYSSSLADGRYQVLIKDLILWRVKLLQFHQGGEHHVELVPLSEQVRHCQQLQKKTEEKQRKHFPPPINLNV